MTPTPLTDAWRETLRCDLNGHGRKATLARYLETHYGRTSRSWQRHIQQILSTQMASAEVFQAIEKWRKTHPPGRTDG